MTKKPIKWSENMLPGLTFWTRTNSKRFKITSVRSGECYVGWDGEKDKVSYATFWVLIYLERGDWLTNDF